jgi:hypothetical protein
VAGRRQHRQVGENISGRTPVATIDRVVHPGVLLDESFHPFVIGQPILRSIIRTRILNDVFLFNTRLIGD